jgi:Raf kinase inhibitor-like YbhB/YbcL family protein
VQLEELTMFEVASKAFHNEGEIPARHTCEGEDVSPELEWTGVPEGTRSCVLIVDDPDAPDPNAPKMVWVHWVLYNLPHDSRGLPEGVPAESLPEGTCEGRNDWKTTGWGGPCPPIGRHRYYFRLYALDCRLPDRGALGRAELDEMMQGHILAEATLMGTYAKARP